MATSVGGIPELVEDGVAGRLVEPDARSLARAIITALDDYDSALALAVTARERVVDRHEIEPHSSAVSPTVGIHPSEDRCGQTRALVASDHGSRVPAACWPVGALWPFGRHGQGGCPHYRPASDTSPDSCRIWSSRPCECSCGHACDAFDLRGRHTHSQATWPGTGRRAPSFNPVELHLGDGGGFCWRWLAGAPIFGPGGRKPLGIAWQHQPGALGRDSHTHGNSPGNSGDNHEAPGPTRCHSPFWRPSTFSRRRYSPWPWPQLAGAPSAWCTASSWAASSALSARPSTLGPSC